MELKEPGTPSQAAFPGEIHQAPGGGIVISSFDSLINWARSNSLWPLTFATSCCGIEMMSTASSKYDFSRFGFEVARATPRQADVIIIAGTIVNKMGPVLKRLYDQMADPKYVIAMGACAISGGPFFYNTYSVVKGALLRRLINICFNRTASPQINLGNSVEIFSSISSSFFFTW